MNMNNDPNKENNDDIKKKMENFNEHMLKATAITFSMEGISKDIDNYIQKKITFNNRSMKHLTDLIRCLSESKNTTFVTRLTNHTDKKKPTLFRLIEHIAEEVEITNSILNFVIQNVMEKESSLSKELHSANKHSKEE